MLPKKNRGLRPQQVSELFTQEHKTLSTRFFRINYHFCNQQRAQFAVMVQPKVERSAVKRNRIRRVLYEVIRHRFDQWTLGIRVAILVKKPATALSAEKFREEFLRIFSPFQLNAKP